MAAGPPLFVNVYFHSVSHENYRTNLTKNDKSVGDVLGTLESWAAGWYATELRWYPHFILFLPVGR